MGIVHRAVGEIWLWLAKKLATNAALHEVLCFCPGCGPKETCAEGFAYKGLGCAMMATKTSVYFSQELPSLIFGNTSLKDPGGTFLVQFSIMNFVGFRTSNDATGLSLILKELIPSEVGKERLGPWGNYSHNFMGRWCYFGA